MKKAVVCEKEERKRQRKAALCNLRAKKRWKFWEKRLWILFWLAILRNARTASSTTLWGCTVAGCTDYDVSDGFSDSNTDWKILLFKEERTASCKLYPRSFCDFSSGIGGDIIRFASAVLGLNNWEACRYLIEAFSLPFSLSGHTDNREQIRRREQERQRQQEKEKGQAQAPSQQQQPQQQEQQPQQQEQQPQQQEQPPQQQQQKKPQQQQQQQQQQEYEKKQ